MISVLKKYEEMYNVSPAALHTLLGDSRRTAACEVSPTGA